MCCDLPFWTSSVSFRSKRGQNWLNVVSSHSYIGGATAPPDIPGSETLSR